MEHLGNFSIHLALCVCVYGIWMSFFGGQTRQFAYVASARNAATAVIALVSIASASLWSLLLCGKFHVDYVYQYTNTTMPTFYKIASFWGGQNGSLLFWLLILCVYMGIALYQNRNKNLEFLPYVLTTLLVLCAFFLILLVFTANPFQTMPFFASNGKGLNPLLQNYYMIIHPPSLYFGYVGMSIPFAFAISALITGKLDNDWIHQVRIWSLIAWFFLSIGNLLGASWAYEVLGWGGYWAWDPVENAAFIPWLTSSAFLHSAIIQEKRGMLKIWNMVLVVLSFIMTLVGTFLTRSGIVSSVHSFAQSDIGTYFLVFLSLVIFASTFLLVLRLKKLESPHVLDSLLSRESAFLFNNLVLVGMAFAVLWGTLFPVLSEWVRGTKITVGPPYFNTILIPIALVLLLLTGVGPLIGWRKSTFEQLKQNFIFPIASTCLTSLLLLMFVPKLGDLMTNIYVNASISLCVFVLSSVTLEYAQGMRTRARAFQEGPMTALLRLLWSNRRRYGGYIVHVGIVLLFFGFTGNAFKKEKELKLKPLEKTSLGAYELKYIGLYPSQTSHYEKVEAKLTVYKNGRAIGALFPGRVFYKSADPSQPPQPSTEVSILRSLKEDVYTALLTFDPKDNTIFVKAVINPLVEWIWIGGLVLILGGIIVMWPGARPKHDGGET